MQFLDFLFTIEKHSDHSMEVEQSGSPPMVPTFPAAPPFGQISPLNPLEGNVSDPDDPADLSFLNIRDRYFRDDVTPIGLIFEDEEEREEKRRKIEESKQRSRLKY